MIDIWDEKPGIRAIDMHYQHTGGDYENFYEAEKMDAWLEKLKVSFDESIADCHHSIGIITRKLAESREKAEKLEARASERSWMFENRKIMEG